MKKPFSIRLPESIRTTLETNYGGATIGAQTLIDSFFELQRQTERELKGLFTREELLAIVDNFNGSMRQPDMMSSARHFWYHLEDGDKFDGLFSKWEVDGGKLMEKVMELTAAQAFFIQTAAFDFWAEGGNDLNDFLKKF